MRSSSKFENLETGVLTGAKVDAVFTELGKKIMEHN